MIEYFESRAALYSRRSQQGLWSLFRNREFASVVRQLKPSPGHTLLELGCGAGHYASQLHSMGLNVTGVDSSPAMLRHLVNPNVRTILSSAENVPPLGVFDRVLAAGVFEFLPDVNEAIRRAVAMLSPAGKFVVLAPTGGIAGALYKICHEWNDCAVFLRDRREYEKLFGRYGLAVSAVERPTPISMTLCFERK